MSKRGWKWAAMAMSGGVLLQVSGCGMVIVEWLINAIVSRGVQFLVGSLFNTGTA